jgi:hypothetical protein
VRERAVGDDAELGLRDPELDEAPAGVLRVGDDRVDAVVEAALGGALEAARLARQHVVGGQDRRPAPGQQQLVELLQRQPLEVQELPPRTAGQAHHVPRVGAGGAEDVLAHHVPRRRPPAARRGGRTG